MQIQGLNTDTNEVKLFSSEDIKTIENKKGKVYIKTDQGNFETISNFEIILKLACVETEFVQVSQSEAVNIKLIVKLDSRLNKLYFNDDTFVDTTSVMIHKLKKTIEDISLLRS